MDDRDHGPRGAGNGAALSARIAARPAERTEAEGVRQAKRAEDALHESEIQFRAVFDAALDAMAILDGNYCYVDANPAAYRMLGLRSEDIIARPLGSFSAPECLPAIQEIAWKAMEGGDQRGTLSWTRPDGTKLLLDYGFRLNFLPGRHLVVLRDMTEKVQLEQRFRQAQKMEAIGRLAGGVAHDFNNLLTIISGYCDMALETLGESDPMRENFLEISNAGTRAAGLTRQLLAFSRNQVLQPRVLDLNTVIAGMESMLRRLIREDIELMMSLADDLGRVKVDAGQFEQVIMNLAVNGRDAMPNGGKLLIETANVDFTTSQSRQGMPLPPGPYVTVAVSDTGVGMDPDTLNHMFEPFFTTKEKGQGTGLGLCTVYGIVKQSAGDVRVFSEPGRGSTFRIYLPQVTEQGEQAVAVETATHATRANETVLLVEDDAAVRTLMCEILRRRGYKVIEAPNGEHALLKCAQFAGGIDVIITDVIMPGMSGQELLKRLKPLRPEMRSLLMSGHSDNPTVRAALADGAEHFIQKPFSPQMLAAKVREVLDRADPHCEQ